MLVRSVRVTTTWLVGGTIGPVGRGIAELIVVLLVVIVVVVVLVLVGDMVRAIVLGETPVVNDTVVTPVSSIIEFTYVVYSL